MHFDTYCFHFIHFLTKNTHNNIITYSANNQVPNMTRQRAKIMPRKKLLAPRINKEVMPSQKGKKEITRRRFG